MESRRQVFDLRRKAKRGMTMGAVGAQLKAQIERTGSKPYSLLLLLLVFNAFRPDRLIPGGAILTYVPTLILFLLVVAWIGTKPKRLSNVQTKWFAAFLVVMVLGTIGARNQYWGFKTCQSLFLYAFLPYLVFVQFVDSAEKLGRYIRWFVCTGLFFICLGIAKKGVIAVSALEDENEFALFANFLLPMAYFLAEDAKSMAKRCFYYGIAGLSVVGTMISFSRGGLVGLAAVGAYIFLRSRRKWMIVVGGAVMVAFLAIFSTGDAEKHGGEHRGKLEYYWDDMTTMFSEGAEEGTGKERVESWKAGWGMFLDHPVVGVGPSNFGMHFPDYYQSYGRIQAENMWGRVAHSLYFTLIPETGMAGIFVFLMILRGNIKCYRRVMRIERRMDDNSFATSLTDEEAAIIRREARSLRSLAGGFAGATAAYLVTGAFISVLWYSYFWVLAGWWAALNNVCERLEACVLKERGQQKDGFERVNGNAGKELGSDYVAG